MKKIILSLGISLLMVVAVALIGCSKSDQGTPKAGPQTMCPVMGEKIDKKYYVDYKGKRVYFCCDSCPKMFQADPEQYMEKMAEQGVVLEDSPAAIPSE